MKTSVNSKIIIPDIWSVFAYTVTYKIGVKYVVKMWLAIHKSSVGLLMFPSKVPREDRALFPALDR